MAKTVLQIAIDEEDLPIFESLFEKFEVESSVIEEKAKPLFTIAVEDIQSVALERLGRTLSDDELLTAKKGLEWGLLTDTDAVYSAIFDEIK
ncbi:hypothetical protein [Capnocytophaga sputigena]|jgi:hypothetical protein|uniref:hypothetical protein n=1 Tax=Capnocytophaga sputigena TaxID=1019 RepID=UPI0028D00C7D|nr:hypothetical protein [Capnocytophaga sputigena]